MLKPAKTRLSIRTYWRYSKRHKWHVSYGCNCHYGRRSLKRIEADPDAQILYHRMYTRPPGEFCKACLKSAHFKVAASIEDCR